MDSLYIYVNYLYPYIYAMTYLLVGIDGNQYEIKVYFYYRVTSADFNAARNLKYCSILAETGPILKKK